MGGAVGEAAGERSETLVREDAPKLLGVLKEMKDGLDLVRGRVETLTRKVKKNQLSTSEGISYLEAKHLLLLSYCQDIVYYMLRKAKGLSVESHPVVRSLVEIRLFLEKIRPIDKKMEYQIQKLTNAAEGTAVPERAVNAEVKGKVESREEEDPLKYRPNPDMLVSKSAPDGQDNDGVYHPPKFMPTSMDEDKRQKQASRREKALARFATRDTYLKEIMDDVADRPEELKETTGDGSRDFVKYMQQREKLEKQEEELFTRAPVTRRDKQMERQMRRQINGLQGVADGFLPGINMMFNEEKEDDGNTSQRYGGSAGGGGERRKHMKSKKRKRR